MDNAVHDIHFGDNRTVSVTLFQYDTGQKLYFDEFRDAECELQYSDGTYTTVSDGQASIPDSLLETPEQKTAWIRSVTNTSETTLKTLRINITQKVKKQTPEEPEGDPEQA